ncbi:Hypothetical predicted protein [Olea europaea subsp. europaea]|uniref:Uncharacterized protein n=1 Tax=Olea europaea subsp. europaea TaxID=158383 RepID=A0A8S0PJR5_OLEEU|nr:Hypothetical predicted protein [Olea europaea subsp. europaea]
MSDHMLIWTAPPSSKGHRYVCSTTTLTVNSSWSSITCSAVPIPKLPTTKFSSPFVCALHAFLRVSLPHRRSSTTLQIKS